jgi:hypothetical protein
MGLIGEWLNEINPYLDSLETEIRGERGPEPFPLRALLGGWVYLMMNDHPPQIPKLHTVLKHEATQEDLEILGIERIPAEITLQRASARLFKYMESAEPDELARLQPFFDSVIPPSAGAPPPDAIRAIDTTLFDAYAKPVPKGQEHRSSDPDARWRSYNDKANGEDE